MASLSQLFRTDEIHNLVSLVRLQAAAIALEALGDEKDTQLTELGAVADRLQTAVLAAERRGDEWLNLV